MAEEKTTYWYLRDIDFRPEEVSKLLSMKAYDKPSCLTMLMEAGNIFPTRDEAENASTEVRSLLAQRASSTESESKNRAVQAHLLGSLAACRKIQRTLEETLSLVERNLTQIQGICGGQAHGRSQDDPKDTAPV